LMNIKFTHQLPQKIPSFDHHCIKKQNNLTHTHTHTLNVLS